MIGCVWHSRNPRKGPQTNYYYHMCSYEKVAGLLTSGQLHKRQNNVDFTLLQQRHESKKSINYC